MAVVASGCASGTTRSSAPAPTTVRGVAAVEPAANPRPLGAADTAFGLDVLRAWCAQYPRQNLVFSPSTLASALGMAYLGARGATARIMAGVLDLPTSGQSLAAELQARTKALGGLQSPGVTLAASDNVWADPTLPLQRGYLNAVATGYGAGVTPAPFSSDPQAAANEINRSISQATHGHITQLVSPAMLTQIGWVLTSALYMNAAWATPFDPSQTLARAVYRGRRAAGHREVHERRRVRVRRLRRMAGGVAALQGREADDDRAAAPVGRGAVARCPARRRCGRSRPRSAARLAALTRSRCRCRK